LLSPSSMVFVQAQDPTGIWRTYTVTVNDPQMTLLAMQSLKTRFPTYRVRTIDERGNIIDIFG
jgi:hypothetical protein